MSYVKVAELSDLEPDTPLQVQVGAEKMVVVRVGDEVFAVSASCSHEDEPLAGGFIEECSIECPRHGAMFDLKSGAALTLPAVKPLQSYPVRLDGTAVLVSAEQQKRKAI